MTVLVTGATGTVGRHIVAQLVEQGEQVRAMTRNPATAGLPASVDVVQGDLSDDASLAAALEGVDAVHLITFNGVNGAYIPLENGEAIVEAVLAAGVRRVSVLHGGDVGSLENALAASTIEPTIVMPVEFMGNILTWGWDAAIRAEGVIREPFAGRLSALVHEADIAAVAVAALTEEGHAGRTYLLTGPEALLQADKVRIIGEAIGRELAFVELTVDEAKDRWRSYGMDDMTIEFLTDVLGNTPPEGYTVVATVEQVTGRPARTFKEWAVEHAVLFE